MAVAPVALDEVWPALDGGIRAALAARGGWNGEETTLTVRVNPS